MGRSLPTSRKYWKRWGRGERYPFSSRVSLPRIPAFPPGALMFKFKASDLPEILTRWSARYSVFVPSGSPDNAQMRIWSRRTRKEVRFMEPDEYTNLIVAPKGFVFGEREELFRWEGNEKTCTAISAPSSVILAGRGQDPVRSAALRHVRAGLHGSLFSRRAPRHQLPFAPPARVHRRRELP